MIVQITTIGKDILKAAVLADVAKMVGGKEAKVMHSDLYVGLNGDIFNPHANTQQFSSVLNFVHHAARIKPFDGLYFGHYDVQATDSSSDMYIGVGYGGKIYGNVFNTKSSLDYVEAVMNVAAWMTYIIIAEQKHAVASH